MSALPPPQPRGARGRAAVRRSPGDRIPPRPDRSRPSLSLCLGASLGGPPTSGPDRLLGPCFKTGRQGSRQSPADPGHLSRSTPGETEGTATRRHRERSRQVGLNRTPGRPGPITKREGTRGGPSCPGQVRPNVPSSVGSAGATRPGCRHSVRAPRRESGVVGGTPPGRPLPASHPVAGAAPERSARGRNGGAALTAQP